MLSRVAERLYWMSRYLERSEDVARLVNAYGHLILDIPKGTEPGWKSLLDTIDAAEIFQTRYTNFTERNVVKFLIADTNHPSSVRASVKMARENVRTSRDVLPSDVWELINEYNLYVNDMASRSLTRQSRFTFLDEVIARSQQINGIIESTVLHDHGLWFMQLGKLVERADMTSRIVDIATDSIFKHSDTSMPELLSGSLLRSLSAMNAYRRRMGPTVSPNEVVDFVFTAASFPRSILFCINRIEELVGTLGAPNGMFATTRRMLKTLQRFDAEDSSLEQLHAVIDQVQFDLGQLHGDIHATWFAREPQRPAST